FRQAPHAWWHSLPTTWLGQALSAAAQGQAGTTITYLAISLVLAAVLAVAGVLLAAHLFATGWATYQEVGTHRRTKAVVGVPAAEASVRRELAPTRTNVEHSASRTEQLGFRQVWRPLWRKDWLNVRRDPQMLARMVYPLIIVVFGLYRTISNRSSGGSGMTHGVNSVTFFITLAIYAYFLTNFLSSRLVNREGRSLYLLALAPLAARDIFLVKWAFGALPIAALVEVILLIGSVFLHLAIGAILLSIATFGCLVVAMVGAALTLSLIWPRLDWDNPSRQVSTQALLFTAVGGLILSAGTCALLAVVLGWASSRSLIAMAAGIGIFAINGGAAVVGL
ncbi:MAG: putative ABC transporter permease subunit, partial [Chloroflexota bacterium]